MYDKIIEQAQAASKPMTDLLALNTKTIENLTEKQTSLVSEILNHNMSYAKDFSSQKDIASIYETQKNYMEGLQEKMVSATKDAYSIITSAQEEAASLVKGATAQAQHAAQDIQKQAHQAASPKASKASKVS